MDASVIYVNWNCAEEIAASVESVRAWNRSVQFEVIVVDNASPQGTGTLEQDRGIQLIRNPENGGFGAGCNLGAVHASGRYLLFLNPDTRFESDVLGELVCFLDNRPSVGLAGPLIVNEGGKVSFEAARSLPTLFNEFLQHSTLAFRFPNSAWASQPYLSDWDHLSSREVESVIGACMLVRSQLFRTLEGFDERFFLYSEELDLCRRLRLTGSQVWYVHSARLMHKERRSTIQLFGSFNRVVLQNMRSQHYYFRKHHGPVAASVWRHMIAVLYLLRYFRSRDEHHFECFRWAMKG